jgi:hypothetical protein
MLRAIPTRYAGTDFRSRIEARWALLLDELHVKWQYELEGFQLSKTWYLPDFWLPGWKCFAEVKGCIEDWTPDVLSTCRELASLTARPLLLLDEIRLGDSRVPALLPGEPCAHDEHACDLYASSLRDRLWHEWFRDSHEADVAWIEAAYGALKERFRYDPRRPRRAA